MDLVYAHPAGSILFVHRSLSMEERSLLRDHRDGSEDAEAAHFLQEIWRSRLWLACDCRSRREAAPILFVRRTGPQTYRLAHMTERAPHATQCAFAYAGLPAEQMQPPCESSLASLLYRWFQAARLQVVYPYAAEDSLHQQYIALREAAKSLDLAVGRRLYDYSRSHPAGLPDLLRRIQAYRATTRSGSSLHGVYLACIRELTLMDLNGALQAPGGASDPPTVEGSLESVQTVPEAIGAPGAHATLYEFVAGDQSVRVENMFAQPVYSRERLVLLGGAHERGTMSGLLRLQREMLESEQILITLRKSLPGSSIYERGIAFQVECLGPNGRPVAQLDIVSIDHTRRLAPEPDSKSLAAPPDALLAECLRAQGTLYHFSTSCDKDETCDQRFAAEVSAWILAGAAARRRAVGRKRG
ncbi:MAG: hypothetical protein ACJ8R9_05485 [Steroidobacteraceae bacterium]